MAFTEIETHFNASIGLDEIANEQRPFALSHNRLQTGGWARQQNGKFELYCGRKRLLTLLLGGQWMLCLSPSVSLPHAYLACEHRVLNQVQSHGRRQHEA